MDKQKQKSGRRTHRRIGIRKRVIGTPGRPRLSVFRSLNHMYAQIIDDLDGTTLVSASTREAGLKLDSTGNIAGAAAVGTRIAEKAKAAGVSKVVFDRGGFRYHGRIKALAEAARKGGLDF